MARRTLHHAWRRVRLAGPILAVAALSGASAQAQEVTFTADVAPIMWGHCVECHRPGSFAPMSLLDYETAKRYARLIKFRVRERLMPPWHIDKNVGVQAYKNDISLNDDQIETIVRWVDAGAPRGQGQPAAHARLSQGRIVAARGGAAASARSDRPLDALRRPAQRPGPVVGAGGPGRGARRAALDSGLRVQAVLPRRHEGGPPWPRLLRDGRQRAGPSRSPITAWASATRSSRRASACCSRRATRS